MRRSRHAAAPERPPEAASRGKHVVAGRWSAVCLTSQEEDPGRGVLPGSAVHPHTEARCAPPPGDGRQRSLRAWSAGPPAAAPHLALLPAHVGCAGPPPRLGPAGPGAVDHQGGGGPRVQPGGAGRPRGAGGQGGHRHERGRDARRGAARAALHQLSAALRGRSSSWRLAGRAAPVCPAARSCAWAARLWSWPPARPPTCCL